MPPPGGFRDPGRGISQCGKGKEEKERRALGFLFAIKQEPWVFLRGFFKDTDENPSILTHCGGSS